MSGYDAWFAYDDSAREPQHTLKLLFLAPPPSDPITLSSVKGTLRAYLPRLYLLRKRAVHVPLDVHHPVWVDEAEVDLDHHVRHGAIPAPGGRRELCAVVSDLATVPLEPDRPPWLLWLLDGCEDGRVVLLLKTSHALADGGLFVRMLVRALSPQPEPPPAGRAPSPAPAPPPAPAPTRRRLLRDAVVDLGRDLLVRLPRLARASLAGSAGPRQAPDVSLPSQFVAPRDALGGPLGPRRSMAFCTLSMARVRAVADRRDATINDVVLGTVAGGVRRYLLARGALPDRPLFCTIAASIRDPADPDPEPVGNRMTTCALWLPTHLADADDRMEAAREGARRAKEALRRRGGVQPEEWIALFPPGVVKGMSRVLGLTARWSGVTGGVMVSNVIGPEHTLYVGSVPVENIVSIGYLKYVAGLNVLVWSYDGKLNVGLCACRDAVPDACALAERLEEAFEELAQPGEGG